MVKRSATGSGTSSQCLVVLASPACATGACRRLVTAADVCLSVVTLHSLACNSNSGVLHALSFTQEHCMLCDVRYQIVDFEDAVHYLRHPSLGPNLMEITAIAHGQLCGNRLAVARLMGSEIDAKKIVSCLTLFSAAAAALCSRGGGRSGDRLQLFLRQANEILDYAATSSPARPRCPLTLGRSSMAAISWRKWSVHLCVFPNSCTIGVRPSLCLVGTSEV